MCEILFRGKQKHNEKKEWVYGDLLQTFSYKGKSCSIMEQTPVAMNFPVIPETVGRFSGENDKNRTKIFEGDIVEAYKYGEEKHIKTITFRNGCFYFGNWNFAEFLDKFRLYKVIGNIYDNPELLK